ncbi:MAG: radical SAM protein [Clostridia bacterium]|nr:radical SAM protein [Clostridia bacterium]
MKTKHVIIPIFIPHKGCPFDCIFCNQKSISGQIEDISENKMREVIEAHISTLSKGAFVEIGFYGGSFTGIEKELQIRYLQIANEYIQKGFVQGVRLSTRPDYITPSILEYLKAYHVNTIELGVQSMDEEVLRMSCRGHSVQDVIRSSGLIHGAGIRLGIQTMIGLPGDNREKSIETAKSVILLKPEILRIYPTLVVKNTFLEKLYHEGKYSPLSLEEAVDLCAELLEMYEASQINVIRVGLQATDNISEGRDIVAGPFHPAFRQLVQSRLVLKTIEEIIQKKGLENSEGIAIYTDLGNISDVVGQKRVNIETLKRKYHFKTVKIIENKDRKMQIFVEKTN